MDSISTLLLDSALCVLHKLNGMRKYIIVLVLSAMSLCVHAQYNIDRLITSGEIALHYEDYVLSIQYFNHAIALKPYLYQPWQYRGAAKFYLDDFTGAESDANRGNQTESFILMKYLICVRSPYSSEKYEPAIEDYSVAIKLNPGSQNYWFNRAVCRMNIKDYHTAHLDVDTIEEMV